MVVCKLLNKQMLFNKLNKKIDTMNDNLYKKYIEYTLSICENQNLVGISNHTIDILQKI